MFWRHPDAHLIETPIFPSKVDSSVQTNPPPSVKAVEIDCRLIDAHELSLIKMGGVLHRESLSHSLRAVTRWMDNLR